MGDRSQIEWTDATWNPTRGCSKVSEGCRNCYAMRQAIRHSGPGGSYEGLAHNVPGKGPQWTGEDCFFRMLQPPEIGSGMAFPPSYLVHGNKRDVTRQYGNAVTPPAMELLMERGIASLEAA